MMSGDIMTKQIVKSFFFLIQQFITQSTRADHGSYVVTTYKRSKLTQCCKQREKREKEKEKREEDESKLDYKKYKQLVMRSTYS